jgi:thioredoxin reductase (NADPH)
LAGETDFLGRGVSYCATCDGLLFRGKTVAVIADCDDGAEDVHFLAGLCRQVLYLPLYRGDIPARDNLRLIKETPQAIRGSDGGLILSTDRAAHAVDGIFIFRVSPPPETLLPDLELESEFFVRTDKHLATSIPGVFAAGDCTGRPWQINRAAGEGQAAAVSAVSYLSGRRE